MFDLKHATVGQRMRNARLRAQKTPTEVATTLNVSSEAQYLDMESSKSPLERFGCLIGRLAVKYGVPVRDLINPPLSDQTEGAVSEPTFIGTVLKQHRIANALSVSDVCRILTNQQECHTEDTDLDATREDGSAAAEVSAQENLLSFSEKEMHLIESGNHGGFERWMAILRAFCLAVDVDPFTLVIGV
jgi:transcriptional regulator with XRE-family HTH domain